MQSGGQGAGDAPRSFVEELAPLGGESALGAARPVRCEGAVNILIAPGIRKSGFSDDFTFFILREGSASRDLLVESCPRYAGTNFQSHWSRPSGC
ncbi:protein of unknown function [Streptomyces murinus]